MQPTMRGLSLRGGALGACITAVLVNMGIINNELPEPIQRSVNDNDELLSVWPSEADPYSTKDVPPECTWFNGSVLYRSQLCSHFVLSRSSSSPYQSFERARRCAAAFDTSCVLSAEIGLAIPAAFFAAPEDREGMRMVIGPRLLPHPEPSNVSRKLIRVKTPGASFGTAARTLELDDQVKVEYLDGAKRSSVQRVVHGEEAYCIQLLRTAFTEDCWKGLD